MAPRWHTEVLMPAQHRHTCSKCGSRDVLTTTEGRFVFLSCLRCFTDVLLEHPATDDLQVVVRVKWID